ncbi:DUF2793 domain-containing protein [Sphingosinicella sp.]|uniref:DUF2793 domain-containing protein n=1 Tax=Sphingosinicella sp. TaxID=1917971 RepID=UPI0040377AB5
MSTTTRFALPLIAPGQAQKEAYHNEALTLIDAALHACVEDRPLTDPPTAPAAGESWLVAGGAIGDWADRDDSLATWTGGGWRFAVPVSGMTAWNKAAGNWLHWSGAAWVGGWPVAALLIDGDQVVGARQPDVPSPSGGTTIDAEARTAIDLLIVTLKAHGLID